MVWVIFGSCHVILFGALIRGLSGIQQDEDHEETMAKSKDDIKYTTAQAKLSEDEGLRVRYKHGTPLEGGKITDSEPVDLFSSAHNIAKAKASSDDAANPSHPQGPQPNTETGSTNSNTSTG
ncbi:hypothetical protein SLA2020_477180 [Shorea laevis]